MWIGEVRGAWRQGQGQGKGGKKEDWDICQQTRLNAFVVLHRASPYGKGWR